MLKISFFYKFPVTVRRVTPVTLFFLEEVNRFPKVIKRLEDAWE